MDNWQEQFEKEFKRDDGVWVTDPKHVRAFIQSLLDQQKQGILEKITLERKPEVVVREGVNEQGFEFTDTIANPYNQAVSDLEDLKKTL